MIWQGATEPLAAVAVSLDTAAASFDGVINQSEVLSAAAAELEEAASCTGCIMLAAAAGPNLVAAGELIGVAGEALADHGAGMSEAGFTPAHDEAGVRLQEGGEAVAEAGMALVEVGVRLEEGWTS